MNGTRQSKAPTRRAIAAAVAETIPAINRHSQNLDVLRSGALAQSKRLDQVVAAQQAEREVLQRRLETLEAADRAYRTQGLVNRLLWLVRGVGA